MRETHSQQETHISEQTTRIAALEARLAERETAIAAYEDAAFQQMLAERIAEATAWQVNESTENIGARRLHTMLERLLETISFEASDRSGDSVTIDHAYVNSHLDELAENEDYARYIL